MKRIHVIDWGAKAWQWFPKSLHTMRDSKEPGCGCAGNGDLGRWKEKDERGVEISYQIPCACLYAVIDASNEDNVRREINAHFINNASDGVICRCMFCDHRRQILEQAKAKFTVLEAVAQ